MNELQTQNTNAPAIADNTVTIQNTIVDVETAKKEWQAYQDLCHALLDESDYQEYQQKGEIKKFPKKSAWVKLGRAFNVNTEIVDKEFVLSKTGETREAYYCIRATLPNGRMVESDGSCSRREKGKDKATSHTIRSTAKTRATNRAIAELIGAGEVSAEELDPSFDNGVPQKKQIQAKETDVEIVEAEFTTADKVEPLNENPLIVTYAKNVAKEVRNRKLSINQRNMKLKANGMIKRGEIPEEYKEELIRFIEENCPGDDK